MPAVTGSCATGMLSGSSLEKFIVFCIFIKYEIRPVLKIKSQSMPVAQEPLTVGISFALERLFSTAKNG